jgi:cytochrome c peroxidase
VRIAYALASHERTLRSDATPFDRWNAGDRSALSDRQYRGLTLFMSKALCAACHAPPMFHDHGFHSLGFQHPSWDKGRAEQTLDSKHEGMFRTPSLRNAGLREELGLLHDGAGNAAQSLDALLTEYAAGQRLAPNTSIWIQPFSLTPEESQALVAFVRHALTDPRVRDELPPFDRPKLSTE